MEMKNKLASLGKPIKDQILVQLVLSGLTCNYEGRIHTLSNHDVMLNFSQVTFKLLTKANVMELCNKQLGDEEALADVSFLHVFSCLACLHIPKKDKSKLDSKTSKCILMRYSTIAKLIGFMIN